MTWSRFEDGYDEHEKIEEAWDRNHATVGLHAMATTACNRWLSDGVIRPKWLRHKLPVKRVREKVLAVMLDVELFDVLRAGETLEVTDSAKNSITLGPFDEDRYVVHDFLDRHDSSVQVKAKRKRDAERKAKTRHETPNVHPDSNGTPDGVQVESQGSPSASRARGRGGAQASPDPTRPVLVSPQPPEGELPAPLKPRGDRKRDHQLYREQITAWAAEHFPGAQVSGVERIVGWLRSSGTEPTPAAIRHLAENEANFSHLLEPAA